MVIFVINFHDHSNNKNRKIDFMFDSAHCVSCMKMEAQDQFMVPKYAQYSETYSLTRKILVDSNGNLNDNFVERNNFKKSEN